MEQRTKAKTKAKVESKINEDELFNEFDGIEGLDDLDFEGQVPTDKIFDINKFDINTCAKITVVGLGGGGGNAVSGMADDESLQNVTLSIANTDIQALKQSKIKKRILIGGKSCKMLGAGGEPERGKKAAEESKEMLENLLSGSDMVFIAVGLGGGTGTGSAPVVAQIAKDLGILTVAVATKPFQFEGMKRNQNADKGFQELIDVVDSVIIVPNDKVLEVVGQKPLEEAFECANNVLRQAVQTITDLITIPAEINLDFADVKATLKNKGKAIFGVGCGEGANKVVDSATLAVQSPLLESSIYGATDAIINITGGSNTTLTDVYQIIEIIKEHVGGDLNTYFGVAVNEDLGDKIIVTIIATGMPTEPVTNFEDEVFSNSFKEREPIRTAVKIEEPIHYQDDEDGFQSVLTSSNRHVQSIPKQQPVQQTQDEDFFNRFAGLRKLSNK